MKKRALALALAVVIAAGLFSGCRKSNIKALYFAVSGSASGFDPQIAAPGAVSIVVRNCFEGLVYVNEAGEALPAAAERWEISEDGLEYTFYLREGAKWHVSETAKTGLEGKLPQDFAPEVTADDFVFALRRAADPVTGARQAYLLSNIAGADSIMAGEAAPSTLGVFARGAYELHIKLAQPEPGLLETLAEPLCMPCNRTFFEATGGRYGLLMKYIISNGPFYLTRFEDTAFRMARNADYTGARAAQADVIWLYSGDTQEALQESLANGDYAGAFVPQSEALGAKIKHAVLTDAGDTLRALLFNPANKALANETLRRAFFAASDVSVLCAEAGRAPAETYCPKALSGQVKYKTGRSETKASALLQQAMEALQTETLSFTLLCEAPYENALRRFLQDWQKSFGITCVIELEALEPVELARRVQAGEYDIAFYPVRTAFYAPWAYFSQFSVSGAAPLAPLEDAAFAEALENLRFCTGDAAKAQKTVEKLLSEQYVLMPVWQEGEPLLLTEGVRGVALGVGEDKLFLHAAFSE